MNYYLKQQKGIWERPDGGRLIRIPLEYAPQVSGFFVKGDTLSSDDAESIMSAYFNWKHAYGNATIYEVESLENAGRYAEVQMVVQRVSGAQKSLTDTLAGSFYDEPTGDSARLTGLRACCHETTTTAYGAIQEADMAQWEGKRTTTSEAITLHVIRTMATTAKIRDGVGGKPDLVTMTETLWNLIVDQLQVQQRFVNSDEVAKAGFVGVHFEGKDLVPDDYCPSGYAFAINSNHWGFAVHQRGLFPRTKWRVIEASPEDRTMKIYFHGNLVCSNRKGQIAHSNLS